MVCNFQPPELCCFQPALTLGNCGSVRRYYGLPSAGLDSHFFTQVEYERLALESPSNPLSAAWLLETEQAFQLYQPLSEKGFCPTTTVSVYRLWNGRIDSNHRYTTDLAVRQDMIANGWIPVGYGALGVVMCAPEAAAQIGDWG